MGGPFLDLSYPTLRIHPPRSAWAARPFSTSHLNRSIRSACIIVRHPTRENKPMPQANGIPESGRLILNQNQQPDTDERRLVQSTDWPIRSRLEPDRIEAQLTSQTTIEGRVQPSTDPNQPARG